MVDNTSLATNSALPSFSSGSLQAPSASSLTSFTGTGTGSVQHGGGMKLEAVMENLQRQQAARLALEEKLRQAEKGKHLRSMVESQMNQQALAFRHYQAAVRGAFAAGVGGSPPGMSLPYMEVRRADEDMNSSGKDEDDADVLEEEEEDEEDEDDLSLCQQRQPSLPLQEASPKSAPGRLLSRGPGPLLLAPGRCSESPPLQPQAQHHEWTYEEQFKQLYELDDDEKRKEFLDDLFSFMQKRGTPVNRIPIMAKQVLDLYMLYKLVTEKGGLVEVINKKIWREITKGLNLPTSITSAAFTLRTQYMKYLYPYECEKRGLSSPGELQAAIDSNRREGRRQSYGSAIFSYSPVGTPTLLSSPNMEMSCLQMPSHSGHISQVPVIKKEEAVMAGYAPPRVTLPMTPGGHHAAAVVQAAALDQLREKLEMGEPPEKKVMMVTEEQQRLMQHALQQNLLAMASQLPLTIKLNNRDDRQESALNLSTSGISSINMSIEINGVVYTGVLFARQLALAGLGGHHSKHSNGPSQGKSSPPQFQPSCSSSSSSSSSSSTSSLLGHKSALP
ncbi:AT-rich interactive domain-containing protein 3A [Neosynchiropus ocellatus]